MALPIVPVPITATRGIGWFLLWFQGVNSLLLSSVLLSLISCGRLSDFPLDLFEGQPFRLGHLLPEVRHGYQTQEPEQEKSPGVRDRVQEREERDRHHKVRPPVGDGGDTH